MPTFLFPLVFLSDVYVMGSSSEDETYSEQSQKADSDFTDIERVLSDI